MKIFSIVLVLLLSLSHAENIDYYGLIVGVNNGLKTESPLKYAEKDAKDLYSLIIEKGNFNEKNTRLLTGFEQSSFRAEMRVMKTKLEEASKQDHKSVFFFYYSGHGSKNAFHVKGEKVLKQEVMAFFDALKSDMRIMVVDACQSGGLLREKGGKVLENVLVDTHDELKSKGSVIITSSAEDELSHESEYYKGAVFTHHLLNGLKGAADFNEDNRVTLWEAVDYSRHSTRNESIYGQMKIQNPSFDFNVVGKEDLTLVEIDRGDSKIIFKDFSNTAVELYKKNKADLFQKVYLSGKNRVSYLIPKGKYVAVLKEGGDLKAATIDLTWQNLKSLSPEDFEKQVNFSSSSKGGFIKHKPYVGSVEFVRFHFYDFKPTQMIQSNLIYNRFGYSHVLGFGFGTNVDVRDNFEFSSQYYRVNYRFLKSVLSNNYTDLSLGFGGMYTGIEQQVIDLEALAHENGEDFARAGETRGAIYSLMLPVEFKFIFPYDTYISLNSSGLYNSFTNRSGERSGEYKYEYGIGIGHHF